MLWLRDLNLEHFDFVYLSHSISNVIFGNLNANINRKQ